MATVLSGLRSLIGRGAAGAGGPDSAPSKTQVAHDSRSTSPGSLTPRSSGGESEERPLSPEPLAVCNGDEQFLPSPKRPALPVLPDYDYPVPFVTRNTFIEMPIGRPPSLDAFFWDRDVHSCPTSGVFLPAPLDEEEKEEAPRSPPMQPETHSKQTAAPTSISHEYRTGAVELPNYDYPLPLFMRNTFIDVSTENSESQEGFYKERESRSCPASGIAAPSRQQDDEAFPLRESVEDYEVQTRPWCSFVTDDSEVEAPTWGTEHCAAAEELTTAFLNDTPRIQQVAHQFVSVGLADNFREVWANSQEQYLATSSIQEMRETETRVLRLADALDMPELAALLPSENTYAPPMGELQPSDASISSALRPDVSAHPSILQPQCLENQASFQCAVLSEATLTSSKLPSVGSVGHSLGTCEPCAFFHTRGCSKAVECTFCHVCDAGERKRRKRAKVAARRAQHEADRS